MIKKIAIINTYNETLELELDNPYTTGIVITNITGLGPVKADINTVDNAMRDGSLFNSARMASRNIVMSLRLLEDPTTNLVETTRHRVYKYFPEKERITFRILTDEMECETDGYVESCEPDIFQKEETQQVSIICPDPYFYNLVNGTYTTAIEPVSSGWSQTYTVQESSIGDDDVAIDFYCTITNGVTKNPVLSNNVSGMATESISFDSDIIDKMLYEYWGLPALINTKCPHVVTEENGEQIWNICYDKYNETYIGFKSSNRVHYIGSSIPPSSIGGYESIVNLYGLLICVAWETNRNGFSVYKYDGSSWTAFLRFGGVDSENYEAHHLAIIGDYVYILYNYTYNMGGYWSRGELRCIRVHPTGGATSVSVPSYTSQEFDSDAFAYADVFSDRTTVSTRPSYMYVPMANNNNGKNQFYRFDGSSWTLITSSYPYTATYYQFATWVMLNGTVHLIGGSSNDSSSMLKHYILSGSSWSQVSTLPIMVSSGGSVDVVDGKIYMVCSPYYSGVPREDYEKYYYMYEYDATNRTWNKVGAGGMTVGDVIHISTRDNNKKAILTRGSQEYNLLPAITKEAKWFKLHAHKGTNVIRFQLANEAGVSTSLIYKKKYKGV